MIAVGIQEKNSDSQNNFSKVIKVYSSDLSGNGSLEEQICEYVNSLNYIKMETDADVWIEYIQLDASAPQPINAQVSNWSEWSQCSLEGIQNRTRYVTTPASNGGLTPILEETQSCNPIITAPIDAVVSEWSEWSLCSPDGFTTRTRTIITPASNGGNTPILQEQLECQYAGRTQIGQYFDDPCGSINTNVWLDTNTNKYYSSEFGSELFTGYLYEFYGANGAGLMDYEWQYLTVQNGICDGNFSTTYSPCSPNYNGGSSTSYILPSAPYGGCSVTYGAPDGSTATLNIPPQDEGLQFTIDVGPGGIMSDSCGFMSN